MPRFLGGLVIAALLGVSAAPLHAWGRRAQTTAYYPASVICVPVYPSAGVMAPVPYLPSLPPAGSAPVYATPTPAPPQGALPGTAPVPPGPMPPAGAGTPGVRESSSYYDAYAATAAAAPLPREGRRTPSTERSSVGFWNNTPREMVLRVDGAGYRLAAGQGMTLDLPRRFTWQIDERAAKAEELSEAAIDIVIRR
jgi:hypothetical protein